MLRIKNKIIRVIKNPELLIVHICRYWPFRLISDKLYIKIYFKAYQGYKLNLDSPQTFNEKLQWLKLYDRNEKYTMLTDKYMVREYIKNEIGEEYLIPILGAWDNANQINFDKLPNQFVLKCNHDSGSVVICKNKEELNIKEAICKLNKALKKQYFWKSREYNYKNIKRKIIAEKYMEDEEEHDLKDYKFFCFNGEPKFIQVDMGRFTNHIRNFYTTDWNYIPVNFNCYNDEKVIVQKPKKLEEMLSLVKKLSKNFVMVRVDLYQINGKIYFGEMTFHHGGGGDRIRPFEYDKEWGKYIKLDQLIEKGNDKN